MSSLAEKHLGVPVTLANYNFDDEEPVMYILKECVDFVNLPNTSGYERALQAHLENAKVICDLCWEMLNVGDWKKVQLCWRQMYSFGSLLKALCELGLEKPTKLCHKYFVMQKALCPDRDDVVFYYLLRISYKAE